MGENLSEGEKQLVSIARILLKKSTIIIVDEPTSRIDEKTEELVTSMLNTCFKDCLLITIAHRIKTILESDKILVLDHGKIMEFDSPENLLADQGTIFSGIIKAYNQNRINWNNCMLVKWWNEFGNFVFGLKQNELIHDLLNFRWFYFKIFT